MISIPHVIGNGVLSKNTSPENLAHVVLDLETLGVENNARIISIGAVGLNTGLQVIGYFYMPVKLDDLLGYHFSVDVSTFNWWMQQSRDARDALNLVGGFNIKSAISYFCEWLGVNSLESDKSTPKLQTKLWGNGPEFDNIILKNAFACTSTTWPFAYNSAQSLRTIRYINDTLDLDVEFPEPYIKHHALYDAEAEAIYFQNVMKRLLAMEAQISDVYTEVRDTHTHHG